MMCLEYRAEIWPLRTCLERLQEIEDEGLTVRDHSSSRYLILGFQVEETMETFGFKLSEVKALSKGELDESKFHGKTLDLVKHYNRTMEEWQKTNPLLRVLRRL